MDMIIGPILKRAGGYVFDTWNACEGLTRGYPYRRIEDATYARNTIIRIIRGDVALGAVVCHTVDEFIGQTARCTVLAAA